MGFIIKLLFIAGEKLSSTGNREVLERFVSWMYLSLLLYVLLSRR